MACEQLGQRHDIKLLSPASGQTIHNNMPVLSWSEVSCQQYEVWLDGVKMATLDSLSTSYTPFPMSYGDHKWRVVAVKGDKKIDSNAGAFTIDDKPLTSLPDNALLLRDNWQLKSSLLVNEDGKQLSASESDIEGWHTTSIPVTVLSALVRNSVYPNPYVGLNNMRIPDASDSFNIKNNLLKYSHIPDQNPWKAPYWFKTAFSVPDDYSDKTVWLNFGEINYRAEVWLNGDKVADTTTMIGMDRHFRFDVTPYLYIGAQNRLAVAIYPPDHPGEPSNPPVEPLAHPGRNLGADAMLTKDYTKWDALGWDWQPAVRDRDMGVIEDVYLSATEAVELKDLYITADLPLPDTSSADIVVSADIVNHAETPKAGVVTTSVMIDDEQFTFDQPFSVGPGETQQIYLDKNVVEDLHLKNPKLWWPAGYGEQNLYKLKMDLRTQSGESCSIDEHFGIREVETYIGENERVYKVNGRKIYCRAGNWVLDMMLNWTAGRYEDEIKLTKNANLNLLRIWGPTGAPPEAFYDAADQHGILLWQDFLNDFWGTFKNTPGYRPDEELFKQASIEMVKKYRNHPSLVIWCGGNEGPNPREDLIMNEILPKYDGRDSRHYLRISNGDGLHGGGPYHTLSPEAYFGHEQINGFSSEIGPSGVPVYESMTKFITNMGAEWKEGKFPINGQWTYHDATDRTGDDLRRFSAYDQIVRSQYGESDSTNSQGVKDYLRKCQLVNYDVYRAAIEALNRQLWTNASGFALWKSNSSWPSVTWQIYDWYLQSHAGYYGTKKASESIHIQLNRDDMSVAVLNTKLKTIEDVQIVGMLYDADLNKMWDVQDKVDLSANAVLNTDWVVPENEDLTFLRLQAKRNDGEIYSDNFYWLNSAKDFTKLNQLSQAKLSGTLEHIDKGSQSNYKVKLTNTGDNLAFMIALSLNDKKSGEEILPSYWSDNYVSLMPGESVSLTVEADETDISGAAVVEVKAYNMTDPVVLDIKTL